MTRFMPLRRCGAVVSVENDGITAFSEILPDRPWPERRKEVERRWLKLLGDFPTEIPALRPEMTEVAKEDGVTRYHVSFQTEADDRGTAWLLELVLLSDGHGYPGVARRLTFAWFDRWLGRKLE